MCNVINCKDIVFHYFYLYYEKRGMCIFWTQTMRENKYSQRSCTFLKPLDNIGKTEKQKCSQIYT